MQENTWIWLGVGGLALYLWSKSQADAAAAAAAATAPVQTLQVGTGVTSAVPVSVLQPVAVVNPTPAPILQPIVSQQPIIATSVNPSQPVSNGYVQPQQGIIPSVPVVVNSSGNLVSQWSPNVTNQFNKTLTGFNQEEGD